MDRQTRRPFPTEWALLLLICAVGAALRFWRLGSLPPGLYHDEGYYALDALKVIGGARPVYFPANNGREPLFIYLLAVSISALGRNPYAVRLPAALVGALLIPAAYGLGRALFNRRVALLGAAITAFTFWPVSISRIGLRAGILPLVAALAVGVMWVAFSRREARLALVAGALYGLTFYTYLAARLTPLALALFAAYLWFTGRVFPSSAPAIKVATPQGKVGLRRLLLAAAGRLRLPLPRLQPPGNGWPRLLVVFGATAFMVASPLFAYAAQFPDIFFKRSGELSILGQSDFAQKLVHNILVVLGMFWFTGDSFSRPRHNVPGRPFFDPLMGAAALAGLLLCLYRLRRARADTGIQSASALTLIWTGVMLLPTILTVEAPYFLRTVGILPFVSFLPALGLDAGMRWLEARDKRRWGRILVTLLLAASLLITVRDYFVIYASDPELGYSFETDAAALAAEINAAPAPILVDRRYWSYFTSVEFLTRDPARVTVFDEGTPLAPTPGAALFIWPYEDMRPSLQALPPGSLISAHPGPLFKNDVAPRPYSFYSAYFARPAPAGEPRAVFENGMGLQSAEVARTPTGMRLSLVWAAGPTPGGDYHVFAQALDGGLVVAQSDDVPAEGLYPTAWWRPGDFVADVRELPFAPTVGTRIIIGLYNPVSGERLRLLSGADFVEFTP